MVRLFVMMSLVAFAGCQRGEQPKVETHNAATTSISVTTARCEMCIETITKALKDVDGVRDVSVNLDKKIAEVKFDPAKADLQSMEKAIALAGYDANTIRRDSAAYLSLAPCCQ